MFFAARSRSICIKWRKPQSDARDNERIIRSFECSLAVGKREVIALQLNRRKIVDMNGLCADKNFGDFLAVCTDVLHEAAASGSRNAAERFDAAEIATAGFCHDFVKVRASINMYKR